MLTILTTIEKRGFVNETVATIDRLNELVTVSNNPLSTTDLKTVYINEKSIGLSLDWFDQEPPYLFPKVAVTQKNLLALTFYKLGNHQKAFEFVEESNPLYNHLLIASYLNFGYEISNELLQFCKKNSAHNAAIVSYYGALENASGLKELKLLFKKALNEAKSDEEKVFTGKHYLNLLLDSNDYIEAEKTAKKLREIAISEDARQAMDIHLASALMGQLKLPYSLENLDQILELQLRCISFYELKKQEVQAGLLLVDAAEIANYKEDFITSKELINKAIAYFKKADIPEFLGEAGFKKAILLYTWSKNGHPQYYKAAINAFQDVLKVYKRDSHPKKFADVHHNLALIYSEIPVSPEEKPMWTAFCASSFKEVLAFYTKEEYPYEYAMASHNYATALMHFPPAKIHDNLEKAAGLFKEALEIRTIEKYPFERALTLLNQLELEWLTNNDNQEAEQRKYEEMKSKAEEVKQLITDPQLILRANKHLEELEKLKNLI